MTALELPNRRVEAWKYSDLRAALSGIDAPLRDGRDVIERLSPETSRTEVAAGESKVVVELITGAAPLDTRSSEFDIADGGALTRIIIQDSEGVALSSARVQVATDARFTQFVMSAGGRLARLETAVDVTGPRAQVQLNGVYLAAAGRHADLTSTIRHAAEAGVTRQLIKGVARAGGRGVFQGKIVVEPSAQQTDARQHHQGMLLEAGAEIFAKPELMIHADDVQCAHGNTAGGIDAQALFYLRSRGVPEAAARALLVEAFLLEALPASIPSELQDDIKARIGAWLQASAV